MIWEPFILALVLGIIVSAGLYFAYVWEDPPAPASADDAVREPPPATSAPATEPASPAS